MTIINITAPISSLVTEFDLTLPIKRNPNKFPIDELNEYWNVISRQFNSEYTETYIYDEFQRVKYKEGSDWSWEIVEFEKRLWFRDWKYYYNNEQL